MSWDPSRYPRGRGAVRLKLSERLATVVFDNPEARNAMSVGMMADLVAIVDRLETSNVLAVLMHGADGAGFCAGGDLRDVRSHLLTSEAATGMPEVMGEALDRLAGLPAVVVAAVEGAALGGGAELITAADWVVASDQATIGFVHVGLGVTPGWGGARRLVRRVGARAALPIMLHAKRYTGPAAHQLGMVDQLAPQGAALSSACEWIDAVLRHPEESVRGALEIIRKAAVHGDLDKNTERDVFARLWGGEAHTHALGGIKAGG